MVGVRDIEEVGGDGWGNFQPASVLLAFNRCSNPPIIPVRL